MLIILNQIENEWSFFYPIELCNNTMNQFLQGLPYEVDLFESGEIS